MGEITVWPFNDTIAYYINGDEVSHVACPIKMGGSDET